MSELKKISQWIQNPDRSYKTGLDIYNKHKVNSKHDAFFSTKQPTSVHKNMLLNKVSRIFIKLQTDNPVKQEPTSSEPIKIRKISTEKKNTETTTEGKDPVITTDQIRADKSMVNKLLVMEWSKLSYNEKLVFYNSETYFLDKKTLLLTNGDIEQKMRSLHSKLKAIDEDPVNDEKRKVIMEDLDMLESKKSENWITIDTWVEPDDIKTDKLSATEQAAKDALDKDKAIKKHKIYIYRALKSLPEMPTKTEAQRKRIAKKKKEVEARKQELIKLGDPYKEK